MSAHDAAPSGPGSGPGRAPEAAAPDAEEAVSSHCGDQAARRDTGARPPADGASPPADGPAPPADGPAREGPAPNAQDAETQPEHAEGEAKAAPKGSARPGGEAPDPPESDAAALDRARAGEYLALAQRTQADFENYRKRVAREAALAETRGAGRVARELLPALDNLALALDAADAEGEGAGHLAEGIRLVQSELHAALRRVGIEPFSPDGERFDPAVHEAMASQPADGVEPGTVLEVYQRGYRHHDTVLRPARVVVSAAAG